MPIGDFNGELRLMAQAWTEDDFGSSESKVIVAAPVIAELNTPRFLASGDTSRLTLDDKPDRSAADPERCLNGIRLELWKARSRSRLLGARRANHPVYSGSGARGLWRR
jgi:hypothetical protein